MLYISYVPCCSVLSKVTLLSVARYSSYMARLSLERHHSSTFVCCIFRKLKVVKDVEGLLQFVLIVLKKKVFGAFERNKKSWFLHECHTRVLTILLDKAF